MIFSTGLVATGNRSTLYYTTSAAVDIDLDGDLDIVVAGYFGTANLYALLNDGLANFVDGTAEVFGSLPGFENGRLVIADLNNDTKPDLAHSGQWSFCGPRVLLQRLSTPTSTTSSPSSFTSSSSLAPAASSSSSLFSALGSILLLLCAFE
jgi:hypothetical protein